MLEVLDRAVTVAVDELVGGKTETKSVHGIDIVGAEDFAGGRDFLRIAGE
jgi:hypothetical protein